jgi:hypothetical protein
MVLRRRQLKRGATEFFVQTRYRRTAIETAVGYVDAGFAHSLQEHRDDSLAPEFSSIEPKWVIETIYQGAYLRQYHLWEKDCREYFLSHLSQGIEITRDPGPFPEYVNGLLSSRFLLDIPKDVMDALSTMRSKVNRMEHKEGEVQNDEFVSAADYEAAVAAIERFWVFLVEREQPE